MISVVLVAVAVFVGGELLSLVLVGVDVLVKAGGGSSAAEVLVGTIKAVAAGVVGTEPACWGRKRICP
jgi:hypothetical protein